MTTCLLNGAIDLTEQTGLWGAGLVLFSLIVLLYNVVDVIP